MTVEFEGVKIDTSKMTTEELKNFREELQKILANVNHEIISRIICEHRHTI